MAPIQVTLEFCGGLELLFDRIRKRTVELPEDKESWTLRTLLPWIRDTMLRDRPELFMQDNSVRPGILVMVNDVDWEILDQLEYEIQPNDQITFISTLHGG